MKTKIVFLFLFFIQISCQKQNKTSINEKEAQLNMSKSEMDKLMSCSYIITLKTGEDKDLIQAIMNKFNFTQKEKVQSKIYSDMFEKCVNSIKNDIVLKIFKNLHLIEKPEFTEEIRNIVDIDYTKYNSETDFNLSNSQQILIHKFKKVKELFQKNVDNPDEINNDYEDTENNNNQVYDIMNIPYYIKIIIFIIVFGFLFLGIFYYLKKLTAKPDKKKKKKIH